MRVLTHLLSCSLLALAACSQMPRTSADAPPPAPLERSETLVTEDSAARIEETRVGGEIKRIRVFPKGGQPPYDIDPVTHQRIWKVGEF
jgi:starvation-inducible outer membrane lipoprotein